MPVLRETDKILINESEDFGVLPQVFSSPPRDAGAGKVEDGEIRG